MAKWKVTGKVTTIKDGKEEKDIRYESEEFPGVVIESRKRQIPHSAKPGTWEYTSYFVMKDGEEKEYTALKDAKVAVETGVI